MIALAQYGRFARALFMLPPRDMHQRSEYDKECEHHKKSADFSVSEDCADDEPGDDGNP